MIETLRVEQWLYQLLTGDATLNNLVGGRIYSYLAPQDAAMPFVVFNHQSSRDILGVGTARIMVDLTYQVKAVGVGESFQTLKPIVDRLDQLLQGASGSVLDGRVLVCVRDRPVQYVEVDEGIRYLHLGGLWKIIAQ